MTKPKHTPGPWAELIRENGHIVIHSLNKIDGQVVAKTSGNFLGQVEANAALIAAAPEMLEALETCLEFVGSGGLGTEVNAHAKATLEKYLSRAIAKAKGES